MSKQFFILFLLALYPRAVSAEVNLALHKSYTISPKPNYPLCTDEGDKLQLTDGKSYGSDWRSRSTVGWGGMATTPEITIKLEKKSYIDEVRVHSIGGGTAGVEYPTFIAVLISEDGENFGFVSFIGSDDLPKGRYGSAGKMAHIFAAKNIGVEGRFVKVMMEPGGRYLFLDGFLHKVGDANELANYILKALENPRLVSSALQRNRKRVVKSGDRKSNMKLLERIYEELIEKQCCKKARW